MVIKKINGDELLTVTTPNSEYLFDKDVFMEYIEENFNMEKRYAIDLTDSVLTIASLMNDKQKATGFLFYCLPLEREEIEKLMEVKQ